MALRDYMQDLLRSQTSSDDDYDENGSVQIIIVDDNSSSSLPEDYIEDSITGSMRNLSLASGETGEMSSYNIGSFHSESVECNHGHLSVDWVGEPEECRGDSNRIMLDEFRRRQRFLRETLSPKRSSPTTVSPLRFSPSPIITQWTPTPTPNRDSEDRIPRDSQRDRMRQLKESLRIQQTSSPLLV